MVINCGFDSIKIISELLEYGALRRIVAFEIVFAAQVLQQVLFLKGQSLWHEDADMNHQVAPSAAVSLYGGQPLSSEPQCFSGLRAGVNLDSDARSLQCGYLHLAAKGGGRKVEQQVVDDILTVAYEGVVFFFLDVYLDISAYAVSLPRVTLARYVHHHAFRHSCRYFNLNDFLAFHHSGTVTQAAFVFDDGAFAVAGWTFCLRLHHAQHGSYRLHDDATSVTGRTGFRPASVFRTAAMAVRAGDVLFHFELFGNSRCDFL